VRAVDEAQVHATVAHEFGHLVQYQFATVGSRAWTSYLELRGLSTTGESTSHADSPREIFAEDFRALRGSPLARGNGSIENALLAGPQTVEGLSEFLLDLPDRARRTATENHTVAVYPNPFRFATTVQFTPRAGAANSTAAPARNIRIADVRGRIVRHETVPALGDGSASWRWDGSDDHGTRLAPGAYFLLSDSDQGRAARIVLAY
jgi:hypothetical protein